MLYYTRMLMLYACRHSDSMDASSYKNPPGPLLNPNMSAVEMAAWAYIRVPGTGILPGLFCPHYDVRACVRACVRQRTNGRKRQCK